MNKGKLDFDEPHLRESVRLAELRIDDFNSAKTGIDIKTLLVVILATVVLVARHFGIPGIVYPLWLSVIFSISISVTFLCCGNVLFPRRYGNKGLPPGVTLGEYYSNSSACNRSHSNTSVELVLWQLLSEYEKRITISTASYKEALKWHKWAMYSFVMNVLLLSSLSF